ncbi:lysylphosphatidylglycerol synthase transmembrane domain-containing protein [Natronolimnohabitans sp. A-GB9]|uniref:lysylphosphatidylglycerol synthase transmembrane domain-containing protein n=1 Tax=Natronolimnohabitans sp. A-GB9 TaxID=3069757 RepID=UPI0027AFE7CF|nr:lysylphosphatidylglycerol synthase transmembrane domain-containing protein [Natronolimnohabitans sp. A-GB9]MDQ2048965.1 lysylphosphatidylglycerol synthase transmembrane domain-containing protein [Natronolimnohabitans sp. A-GB9]
MKRRIALGFVVAVILLGLLIGAVGSRDILAELSEADYRLLGLGFLSGALALTFRGLVWERFIALIDETMSRKRIGSIFLTAMFIKYATPYGQLATEPFVAYLVSQGGEMAYEDGLASIVSADLLNYIPYYTFGFLALGMISIGGTLGDGMLVQFAAFAGLFVVVASLVYVVVRCREVVYRLVLGAAAVVRRLVGRLTDRFDDQLSPGAVRTRLDGFYTSVETITTDRRTLVIATVYAHLGMAFLMLPVYIGAIALGYQLALPVVAIVVALGKLGSVVPAPGGTGGVEAIVTAGLTTIGQLEPAAALTVALIYRVCTYWLTIGVGGLSAVGLLVGDT